MYSSLASLGLSGPACEVNDGRLITTMRNEIGNATRVLVSTRDDCKMDSMCDLLRTMVQSKSQSRQRVRTESLTVA